MSYETNSIFWVEVEKVVPNPFQPRREFDTSKLEELSESIRMYGILQPLVVTRKEVQLEDGAFRTEYELIAGERRLRASKLAGLSQVPVIIRSGEETELMKLELAIIENLQREDLNPVDRSLAFQQLAERFGLSHTQVAKKVGRSREYVSNSIRLLNLPSTILNALKVGDINDGHARTLLMLNDRPEEQDVVFRETLLKKLSVREVERISRKIAQDKVRKQMKDTDPTLIELEKKFTESLGTRVQIAKTDFGGRLTIDYFSPEDLENILTLVKQNRPGESMSPENVAERLAEATPLESTESGWEVVRVEDELEPGELLASHEEGLALAAEQEKQAEQSEKIEEIHSSPISSEQASVQQPENTPITTEPRFEEPLAATSEPFTQAEPVEQPEVHPVLKQSEEKIVASEDSSPKKEDSEDDNLYSIKNFSI